MYPASESLCIEATWHDTLTTPHSLHLRRTTVSYARNADPLLSPHPLDGRTGLQQHDVRSVLPQTRVRPTPHLLNERRGGDLLKPWVKCPAVVEVRSGIFRSPVTGVQAFQMR